MEIFGFFTICFFVDFFFLTSHRGFNFLSTHPYWILVVLVPARYGIIDGFAASLTASLLYIYYQAPLPATDNFLLTSNYYLGTPVNFIVVSLALGRIQDNVRIKAQTLKQENVKLAKDFDLLAENFRLLKENKDLIERRIVGQESTISTMYKGIRRLKNLKEEEIYLEITKLMKEYMNVKKGSVYMLEGNHLQLKSSLNWPDDHCFTDVYYSEDFLFNEIVMRQTPLAINRWEDYQAKVGKDRVLVAVPMVDELSKRSMGMLKIEEIDYVNLNSSTVMFLEVLADWSTYAIKSARETLKEEIHDPLSGAHHNDYFQEIFKREWSSAKRNGLDLSVLLLTINGYAEMTDNIREMVLKLIVTVIRNRFRDTDIVARCHKEDSFIILLPMTPSRGANRCSEIIKTEVDKLEFHPFSDKRLVSFEFSCYAVDMDNLNPELVADL
ncbi:MAG: diguanylate cyclase domain-containing protein [bacterium]